jgi:hypothetical protein
LIFVQTEAAIYNMAAGTCLGAQEMVKGGRVTMELCTKPSGAKWDLLMARKVFE